jgi:hypothetical protein
VAAPKGFQLVRHFSIPSCVRACFRHCQPYSLAFWHAAGYISASSHRNRILNRHIGPARIPEQNRLLPPIGKTCFGLVAAALINWHPGVLSHLNEAFHVLIAKVLAGAGRFVMLTMTGSIWIGVAIV